MMNERPLREGWLPDVVQQLANAAVRAGLVPLVEDEARTVAVSFAAMTTEAVAVERFDVDRGEWLLVDVIGGRS